MAVKEPIVNPAAPDTSVTAAIGELVTQLTKQNNRAVLHSNAQHPGIGPFSYPEGELVRPKPKLARKVFLNGIPERHDVLTPREIEAYNRLNELMPKAGAERLGSAKREGTWLAKVSRNNDVLHLTVPCKTIEQREQLPKSLVEIIEEFISGEAVNPGELLDRVRALEQQNAELQARVAAGAAR